MLSLIALMGAGHCWAHDIFGTDAHVSATPAAPLMAPDAAAKCGTVHWESPVTLFEAIERALCESPKSRSAWLEVKAAAANVGLSQSAYLPTLDGSAKYAREREVISVESQAALSSNYTTVVNEESLTLSWVLYDFGARSASLRNTRQLLLAAQALQYATLQTIFLSTAKDYLAAQAAAATLQSKRELERIANDALAAATARVDKGVAPITDQLQANTALAQAVYERSRAEGELRASTGTLAIDINLAPNEPLTLPFFDSDALPDAQFAEAVQQLLENARTNHPKVLAARAQWQAALASLEFARRRNLPVLRLVGEADRSDQPLSASLGQPLLPALSRDAFIGLSVAIPLFDGFNHNYLVRQAEAQAATEQQALLDTEQQVSLEIWKSDQALQTDTDSLRNAGVFVQSARDAYEATEHRYQAGVGSLLELLSAQNALAVSEQRQIEAELDWRVARLELAESLGTLGLWAIR